MKKSKLLAGVLIASITLLGTGYAYWGDNLTLSTSVETGSFKVVYDTVTKDQGELNEIKTTNTTPGETITVPSNISFFNTFKGKPYYWYSDVNRNNAVKRTPGYQNYEWKEFGCGEYGSGKNKFTVTTAGWYSPHPDILVPNTATSFSEEIAIGSKARGERKDLGYIENFAATITSSSGDEKDRLAITMTNVYPGSFDYVTYTIKNVGTIPVVLDTITPDVNVGALGDAMQVAVMEVQPKTKADVDFSKSTSLNNIETLLSGFYNNVKIEPGKTITTTLAFKLPGNVTAFNNAVKDKANSISFNLNLKWTQHNAELQPKPTGNAPKAVTDAIEEVEEVEAVGVAEQ